MSNQDLKIRALKRDNSNVSKRYSYVAFTAKLAHEEFSEIFIALRC